MKCIFRGILSDWKSGILGGKLSRVFVHTFQTNMYHRVCNKVCLWICAGKRILYRERSQYRSNPPVHDARLNYHKVSGDAVFEPTRPEAFMTCEPKYCTYNVRNLRSAGHVIAFSITLYDILLDCFFFP